MPQPRKALIAIEDTPYYHFTSRCVRRTFLCGEDKETGKNYEHRKLWLENRIRLLASIFTIDICAYAVMSNHYHLVVKLSPEQADDWSDRDVVDRWTTLYKGTYLVQQWKQNKKQTKAEQQTTLETINRYRIQLKDPSWFMKCLNEPIARQANKEENITGHFWEARFKSQALLTEQALLSCMAYVDLNPVRANINPTPEDSEHTSIKERIQKTFDLKEAVSQQDQEDALYKFNLPLKPLKVFEGHLTQEEQRGILFSEQDYLQLVDTTGRIIREDKKGHINQNLHPILERLNITSNEWLENTIQFEERYQKHFAKRRRPREKLADTG